MSLRIPSIPKLVKQIVVVLVIIATLAFFVLYIHNNPELIQTLTELSPITIILLTIGYTLVTIINSFVLHYSLLFIKKQTSVSDNIALTGYSSIVNFFGPLQSGPGFRAIYLKQKYGVRLRDFLVTTLIFYGFFALINLTVLAIAAGYQFGSLLFYVCLITSAVILALAFTISLRRVRKLKDLAGRLKIKDKNFWLIGLGAAAITFTTAAIYFIEIYHIDTSVSVFQALVYTAAANLALFVSLTPGAIGIRESFLVLSQQLHGIDTSAIVGASVIDRAYYVGFLLLLFIVLIVINSRKRLPVFQLKTRK